MHVSATRSRARPLRWLVVALAAVLLATAVVGVVAYRREAEQDRGNVELLHSLQAESEALDRTRLQAAAAGGGGGAGGGAGRAPRLRQGGARAKREAIERSERRLRALVEHAYDLVGVIGPDARLTWVSE